MRIGTCWSKLGLTGGGMCGCGAGGGCAAGCGAGCCGGAVEALLACPSPGGMRLGSFNWRPFQDGLAMVLDQRLCLLDLCQLISQILQCLLNAHDLCLQSDQSVFGVRRGLQNRLEIFGTSVHG